MSEAQLHLEELLKEYSEERAAASALRLLDCTAESRARVLQDKKRVTLDQSFTPDDALSPGC